MDYTQLVAGKTTPGSICNWVNRSDIPATTILAEAEAWIYQRMRVREMQHRQTFTFLEASSDLALPVGFLDPIRYVPYTWSQPLPFLHEEAFQDPRDEDGNLYEGTPSQWTVIGETAYVDVACLEDFGGMLLYYRQPTALGPSNLTNFLTSRYPKLVRHACIAQAYEHMKDTPRSQEYLQYAEMDLQEAMRTNEMFRRGQYVPHP